MNWFCDFGQRHREGFQYFLRASKARKTRRLAILGLVGGALLSLTHAAFAVEAASSIDAYTPLLDFKLSDLRSQKSEADSESLAALTKFAQTVAGKQNASPSDPSGGKIQHAQSSVTEYSALTDFARSVSALPKPIAGDNFNIKIGQSDSAQYAELAGLGQTTGITPSASGEGRIQLAADTALEALQDFLNGNKSQPTTSLSVPPKADDGSPKRKNVPIIEATFVGEKVCMGCHAGHAESFSKTLMGRIGKSKPGTFACENCHGAGSAHAKAGGGRGVGGIISFRSDDDSRSPSENNAICLGCHEKGDRTYWKGSTHESRNVACTNCHTVMKSVSAKFQLKTVAEVDTCFQCHKDRRAQMARSSHMPLREGKMTCSDCHQPHGTATAGLLREASVNDTCYKCHAEKRGPMLFEHLPVRENCLNCHDPHGTINDSLLKASRPRLCQECHNLGHALTSGPLATTPVGIARGCQNCHTKIHGSNSPSGAFLQR